MEIYIIIGLSVVSTLSLVFLGKLMSEDSSILSAVMSIIMIICLGVIVPLSVAGVQYLSAL